MVRTTHSYDYPIKRNQRFFLPARSQSISPILPPYSPLYNTGSSSMSLPAAPPRIITTGTPSVMGQLQQLEPFHFDNGFLDL